MTYQEAYNKASYEVFVCMCRGDIENECAKRNIKGKSRSVLETRLIKAMTAEYEKEDKA